MVDDGRKKKKLRGRKGISRSSRLFIVGETLCLAADGADFKGLISFLVEAQCEMRGLRDEMCI